MRPPRVLHVPRYATTAGDDAIDLAAAAGLHLDEWQQFVLRESLGERPDGKWSAPQVGLLCSRQNGKSAILEARALAGIYLFNEPLVVYSAHKWKTAGELFLRIKTLIEGCPELSAMTRTIRTANGGESVVTKAGNRLVFICRSRTSGRGMSIDTLLLDEAQEFSELEQSAILPTMSARPNTQVWYTGTVPGPMDSNSEVWTQVRDKGRALDQDRLAWFEWSAGEDIDDLDDRELWSQANPALGTRLRVETVEDERTTMLADSFARERLSIWPSGANSGIFGSSWAACLEAGSEIVGPVTFGVAVSLDRTWACVAAAGKNADGRTHLEVVQYQRGTQWVADFVADKSRAHNADVVIDARGPASSLVPALDALGVSVTTASTNDVVTAAADIYDAVRDGRVAHLGDPDLDAAVLGARRRDVGDRWAFGRKTSTFDISPLEAASLAAWASSHADDRSPLESLYF